MTFDRRLPSIRHFRAGRNPDVRTSNPTTMVELAGDCSAAAAAQSDKFTPPSAAASERRVGRTRRPAGSSRRVSRPGWPARPASGTQVPIASKLRQIYRIYFGVINCCRRLVVQQTSTYTIHHGQIYRMFLRSGDNISLLITEFKQLLVAMNH